MGEIGQNMHVDPLYVSHNGELVNLETFPALVDSPFIHHEAPYVRGGSAFLCHEWAVVLDNTKYLIEGFTIARGDHKQESIRLLLIEWITNEIACICYWSRQ